MRRLAAVLLLAVLVILAQVALAAHDGNHALDADHGAGDACALCVAHGAAAAPPATLPVALPLLPVANRLVPLPSADPHTGPATPFRSRAPPASSC